MFFRSLWVVVEIFEVVVGGFRSFHVLVLTQNFNERQRFIL